LSTRKRDEWLAELEACGIPAGPINGVSEAFASPQAQHRQMQRTLKSGNRDIPQVANPLRFDGVSATSETPPPTLGQDSDRVLTGRGLSKNDIAKLRSAGIVR